jgi:hypothetical protein
VIHACIQIALIVLYCYEGFSSSEGEGAAASGAAAGAGASAGASGGHQPKVVSPRVAPNEQQHHQGARDTTQPVDTTQPHVVNVHTEQV